MKKILLSLLLLSATGMLRAQEKTYPAGGYRTLSELNHAGPSGKENFSVFRSTSENLEFYGGNDYNMITDGDETTVKKVWRKYFAISLNDTLYVNCKKLEIGVGFTPVLVKGRYLVFKAYMPRNHSIAGQDISNPDTPGDQAPRGSGNGSGTKRQYPFLWSLDTGTGKLNMLTYGGMLYTLENYPELKQSFIADERKDQEDVMMDYIRKANSR